MCPEPKDFMGPDPKEFMGHDPKDFMGPDLKSLMGLDLRALDQMSELARQENLAREMFRPPIADLALAKVSDLALRLPPSPAQLSAEYLQEMAEGMREQQEAASATGYMHRLLEQIERFEANLDPSLEAGVALVSFGQMLTFHVEAIGAIEPGMIFFRGRTDAGAPVQLVQHLSQISFLLTTLPRQDPDQPRRRIGFEE